MNIHLFDAKSLHATIETVSKELALLLMQKQASLEFSSIIPEYF